MPAPDGYRHVGWRSGVRLFERRSGTPSCRGNDPYCPCQDGNACHYVDMPGSPAMTPKPYTVQQAIADLLKLAESKDYEAAHGEADRALCRLLLTLGYRDVVEAYEKIRKEYA